MSDLTGLVSKPTITTSEELPVIEPAPSNDPLPGISFSTYTWLIFIGSVVVLALQAFPKAGLVADTSKLIPWADYLALVLVGTNGILAHMAKQSAVDLGRKLARLGR
jgi:hypothetical protein